MTTKNNDFKRGALIFAHNNEEIDYFKIACINALMIQKNLGIGVTLVTDPGTLEYSTSVLGKDFVEKCFEKVIEQDRDYVYQQNNIRTFRDTKSTQKRLPFYNCDHWQAFDVTPYEETLFLDADYLIMSDALNNCWGSNQDIMLNKTIKEVLWSRNSESPLLDAFGIDLYWATCIYFKKTEIAEHMFSLAHYVYDNYSYFKDLYSFGGGLFRNDFAFSIAAHMMNGFNNNDLVKELPIPAMYKSFDHDDIVCVNGENDITLLLERPGTTGEFITTRCKGIDLHIMNKWAILRNADKLIEVYS